MNKIFYTLTVSFFVAIIMALSFSISEGTTDDCSAYPFYFCGDPFENYEDDKCHYTPNWFYCEESSDGCTGGHCGDREEIEPA